MHLNIVAICSQKHSAYSSTNQQATWKNETAEKQKGAILPYTGDMIPEREISLVVKCSKNTVKKLISKLRISKSHKKLGKKPKYADRAEGSFPAQFRSIIYRARSEIKLVVEHISPQSTEVFEFQRECDV